MGKRPDYAVTVYCNLIRQRYKKAPIIIGGIEASLRRLAHYDYWSDKLKRSVLLDSQADLLIYGMGERAIVEIADALNDGLDIHDITYIDGTVFKVKAPDENLSYLALPSYPELVKSKTKTMPRASICSTRTPTRSRPSGCWSRTPTTNSSSRIRRRSRFPSRRWTRSTTCPTAADVSPELRSAGRRARDRRDSVQPDLLPRLLRRLQFLRADVPSGQDYPVPARTRLY